MITSKKFTKLLYYQKFLGLFLIVIGIPPFFLDPTPGSEMPLLAGLFIVLVSMEKVEDERSVHLKTTSLYIAFIIGYAVKTVTSNLYFNKIIEWELVEINHFMILVFFVALAIYYFRLYFIK